MSESPIKNPQSSPPLIEEQTDPGLVISRPSSVQMGRRHLVGRALGEIVAELYGVTANQVGQALDQQAERGGRIGEILVGLKAIGMADMLAALATQLDLPFLSEIHHEAVPDEIIATVPIGFARQNLI